jgi:hypothetical protein
LATLIVAFSSPKLNVYTADLSTLSDGSLRRASAGRNGAASVLAASGRPEVRPFEAVSTLVSRCSSGRIRFLGSILRKRFGRNLRM